MSNEEEEGGETIPTGPFWMVKFYVYERLETYFQVKKRSVGLGRKKRLLALHYDYYLIVPYDETTLHAQ